MLPLLTLAVLVQDVLLSRLSVLGGRPDLVLLLVLAWAFLRGPAEGAVWAFIAGILLDLLSGGPFGGITLALLLASLLLAQQWGRELGSLFLQLFLLVLVGCFVYHLVLLLTLAWTGHSVDWQYALARVAAPSALLNAVLAPFVHRALAWLDRRTRPEGFTIRGRI